MGGGAMLIYTEGNLLKSPTQTLVNPVNVVGVMGKGLALQFKQRFPGMFSAYRTACLTGLIGVGRLWLCRTKEEHGKWILNFPTKRHWRDRSRIEDIEHVFRA